MRTLQSGEGPKQRREHVRHELSSGQMRSDGQSKRAARSGLDTTAAHIDRAEETLVESPRRRRQRAREAPKMRLQRSDRLVQQHEHAGRVRTSERERSGDRSKHGARSGKAVATARPTEPARPKSRAAAAATTAREALR